MLTPTGVTASAYWDAIKNGNRTHIRMTFTGQDIVLDDNDIYLNSGVTVDDILNSDIDMVFGNAVSKQISTTILNSEKLSNLVWTGEFKLEFGVEIEGTTSWVQIGYFTGEKPKNITNVREISFTAYDRMKKFDALANDYFDSITYPVTVQDIYDGICQYIGVQNVTGDELSAIMEREYATAPFDMLGYTCRDILSWIAQACGCYARITSDGNVKMVWFTDHTEDVQIHADEEFNYECADEEIDEIDHLMVKQLGSDMDIHYPSDTGSNVYSIIDNPFLSVASAEEVTQFIKPIYDRIHDFGVYLPVSVDCVGNWLIESGDIISADINENVVGIPVFVRSLVWKSGITDTYEATGNKSRDPYSSDKEKQKVLTSKEISLIVGDRYYERQSGIQINSEGVSIFGNKYFNVESPNFDLDSDEGYMRSGKWLFNDNGIALLNNDDINKFVITSTDYGFARKTTPGVYFREINAESYDAYRIGILSSLVDDFDRLHKAELELSLTYQPATQEQDVDFSTVSLEINTSLPDNIKSKKLSFSGTASLPITEIKTESITPPWRTGDSFNPTTPDQVRYLTIHTSSMALIGGTNISYPFNTNVIFDNEIIDNVLYTRLRGGNIEGVTWSLPFKVAASIVEANSITGNLTGNVNGNVTGNLTGNVIRDGGDIYFYPRGTSGKSIVMQEYTTGGTTYTKIYGTGNMVFEGTATKATQDGSGNVITSKYVTVDTAQTITGTKSWGTSGAGGELNGAATNGGINSIRVGDDVWLGDCNAGGIMGMKSTGSNTGFYFYNSSGTQTGQLYADGTYLVTNKGLRFTTNAGIYYTGSKATHQMIHFIDNTSGTAGNGISIGGGGQTIIGGGESANVAVAQVGTGGSEIMYVCNDGNVDIISNLQNGWDSRKVMTFNTNGYLMLPSYINSPTSNNENPTVSQFIVTNGTDHYYRKASTAHVMEAIRGSASGSWGISITGSSASCTGNAATATKLAHTTLNSTTINNTAGSFAFSGSQDPWSGTDWVGLQIGDNSDKFQITANSNTLLFRQNDSGGTNTSWSEWVTMLTSSNYTSYAADRTAITDITRSGTTFTATRANGNTFTFTQQDNDTKNTAGSTNTSSKIFLIGATSQAANPQTYSHDTAYVGTDGCLYSGGTKVLTAHQSLASCVKTTGNQSMSGVISITNTTASTSTTTGALKVSGGVGVAGNIYGAKVYNAVWNDYAECRKAETLEAGRCVYETESGVMKLTKGRLQAGCKLTSDTFGTCMGETDEAKTPIAVAGRVLAYPFRDRKDFHLGDAVCSAPNGTVDIMTREEIREYPERIIGTVSEIPAYDTWLAGTKENPKEIQVNGRIWIYVR